MEFKRTLKTIIADFKTGNTASFEELYRLLLPSLFAFISHRTSTREAAKDVTQDSFVEISKALAGFTYQSDGEFYAFVFTIVRRKLAQHYKEGAKHNTVEGVEMDDLSKETPSSETILSVQQALQKIDECSREIVVLHHWSRYTFSEIATILNMTESAVRVRHHRARATLATLLTS
jgi:RNA polymerase sigma factor (sigma-70 family)